MYNAKISELQTEIEILKTHEKKITLLEEEKEKLERMLREQQKVIKLALARILPRKQEITFCQVIIFIIGAFQPNCFGNLIKPINFHFISEQPHVYNNNLLLSNFLHRNT